MTSTTRTKRISTRIALAYACVLFLVPTAIIAVDRAGAEALRSEMYASICAVFDAPRCVTERTEGTSHADSEEGDTGSEAVDDAVGGPNAGESGGDSTPGTDTTEEGGETTDSTGGSTGGPSGGTSADTRVPSGNVAVVVQGGDKKIRALYPLPRAEGATVSVTSTDKKHTIAVSAHSALVALTTVDNSSPAFSITDLVYYPSFSSFFLNCLTLAGMTEQCGAWQYSVNGTYPSVGLDAYRLTEGDTLYLFYGSTRRVEAPGAVQVGESFSVEVQQYDPALTSYKRVGGYTVGVLEENPDNPWEPTVIALAETDAQGNATFTLTTAGEYSVGIAEDYYYPATPLTVSALGVGGSRAGGGGVLRAESDTQREREFTRDAFSVVDALQFVSTQELSDGTFGAPLYTDWGVIALASQGGEVSSARVFLEADAPEYDNVTDHIRRSMALMAVGLSPYDGSPIDHIAAIRGYFGGMQFGDPALVNDDIFALVVLERAGYGIEDPMISHTVAFLLHEQKENGSWEGSVDLTAAAVQALAPFATHTGVATALFKARAFLVASQETDGGFGDVFATSWVVQAIHALGGDPAQWVKSSSTPLDYLALRQEEDGGMLVPTAASSTRLWATSYAIPAVSGKTWRDILTAHVQPIGTVVVTERSLVRSAPPAPSGTQGIEREDAVSEESLFISGAEVSADTNQTSSAIETGEEAEREGISGVSEADVESLLASAGNESENHLGSAVRMLGFVFLGVLVVYGVIRIRRVIAG